jgi:hypothetical protein
VITLCDILGEFMPNLPLNCLKKHAGLFLLSTALIIAMPQISFAFGSKAPNAGTNSGPENMSNADKLQLLHQAIAQFNQEHGQAVDASLLFGIQQPHIAGPQNDESCISAMKSKIIANFGPTVDSVCRQIAPILEQSLSCADLVEIRAEVKTGSARFGTYRFRYDSYDNYYNYTDCHVVQPFKQVVFFAALTPKAQQLIQAGFLYLATNTDVEYNVRAIQSALGNLVLLPRQRKALDGFFGATDAFVRAIEAEKANALAGKEAKPLTHRFFAEKASLIVAYYRYLKSDFAELAQFSSANGGILKSNQEAVKVIDSAVTNLTKDYGLDSDVTARQVADYGRVLLDLLNNYSLTLTTTEKATIQPVLVQLVTQVIPASEAYGDVGAHDAVVKLKSLWESTQFTALLTDKLSISDDKSTGLILNMSAAAYKLGLSANVDIKTFDARDADRIKNKKFN